MRRYLLARPQRLSSPARSLGIIIRADSPSSAIRAGARFVVGPVVTLEVDEDGRPVGDYYRRNAEAVEQVLADTRREVQS